MVVKHLCKLIFHTVLLAIALILYFTNQDFGAGFLLIIWLSLAVPMMFRIFPNRCIALGARKHFACTYNPAPVAKAEIKGRGFHKGAVFCALGWLVVTAAMLLALFRVDMLTAQTTIIIALAYAVVDIVFVLFFCPFRALFMRNHCCVTCRIHNWDYFMKCAPLILFPSIYTVSLVILSVVVVLRWEISLWRNPHFFMRETNQNLRCSACEDKLCQLRIRKLEQRDPDIP